MGDQGLDAPPAAKRGRPRDPTREAAITDATLTLLGEVSYDEVTVRAIAERAGVGLATIYRRWPSSEDLIADALRGAIDTPELPDKPDGDPRAALIKLLESFADFLSGASGVVVMNVIGQLRSRPDLAEILRSRVIEPRLRFAQRQLIANGQLSRADAALASEALPGWLIARCVILDRPPTRAEIRRAVDLFT